MKKAHVVTIFGLFLLGGGATAYRYLGAFGKPAYETTTVRRGTLVRRIFATGTIRATLAVQVGSQASGTIKKVYVDHNSRVTKSQLLALIDPAVAAAQVAQAKANLEAAKANLSQQGGTLAYDDALVTKANVQLREAELNFRRIEELYAAGVAPLSQLDAARASRDSADSDKKAQKARERADLQAVEAAKAAVAQCEGILNAALLSLDHTQIRSPIDGVVISRTVESGQTVAASFQAPNMFVIAADLRDLQLEAEVSEADIGQVKVGQELTFQVDAYPDKTFPGTVKEIRMGPNTAQKAVAYTVIAAINNEHMLLRPGMTADVWIVTARRQDALLVPAIAVYVKNHQHYVEVVKGREPQERAVTLGLTGDGPVVEILSGLSEGEIVVASGGRQ